MTEPHADLNEFDAHLTERAEAFEKDWSARSTALETQRDRRARRTNRQFWFLFVFLFASFILLAYRTESVVDDLRSGFYAACQYRAAQAAAYNEGREALITLVITNPERPVPPSQQAVVVKQLRDGLLLPLEDCGEDPDA